MTGKIWTFSLLPALVSKQKADLPTKSVGTFFKRLKLSSPVTD